jgi:hypothetical protein
MRWPTWQQGFAVALVSGAVVVALRRTRPTRLGDAIEPAAYEVAIIAALYGIWRIARKLPFVSDEGATDRGYRIDDLQSALGMPSELSLQRFVLDHDLLARTINHYYALVHVPSIVVFLVWLYIRHRDRFPTWRNVLAMSTGFCLAIRFWRVAPPRLLDLGYIDLSSIYGLSVYGPVGTGVSDQYAAMPSIHVAWAAVIAFGAVTASTSPWRWVVFAHLPVTMIVVSATGHHWWLDGIVAIALVGVSYRIDVTVRRRRRSHDGTHDGSTNAADERDTVVDGSRSPRRAGPQAVRDDPTRERAVGVPGD